MKGLKYNLGLDPISNEVNNAKAYVLTMNPFTGQPLATYHSRPADDNDGIEDLDFYLSLMFREEEPTTIEGRLERLKDVLYMKIDRKCQVASDMLDVKHYFKDMIFIRELDQSWKERYLYGDFKMTIPFPHLIDEMTDFASHMAQIEDKVNKDEWSRAGGECICKMCGKEYIRHPNAPEKYYWLTELCDGTLVKL